MKALVTGGAGFIGAHIARALLDRGDTVRLLDNMSSGRQENLDACPEAEFAAGDIRSETDCRRACAGCDVVFHHAALVSVQESIADPGLSFEINTRGTLNMLLAAREQGVKRFVFASSAAVYGDDPTLPKHEGMVPAPISPYGADKAAAEQYVWMFHRLGPMETVTLRYFNVFGPRQDPQGDYAAVIPRFVDRLVRREAPIVFGDGKQTRDFLYIADVVQANLQAASVAHAAGSVFNIARGRATSLLELLTTLGDATGTPAEPRFAPPRPGDIRHSQADVTRAAAGLGFTAATELADGLRLTARYFQNL